MADFVYSHLTVLNEVCRFCGLKFLKKQRTHKVKDFCADIKKVFRIDVLEDNTKTHPPSFCQKCRMVIHNVIKKGTTHNFTNVPEWPDECKEGSCLACINHQASTTRKGRRPKPKICGRPASGADIWKRCLTEEIANSCNQQTVRLTNELRDNNMNIIDLCICQLCKQLYDKTVMLDCQHSFCLYCLAKLFEGKEYISCPECQLRNSPSNVRASKSKEEILQSLCYKCTLCGDQVRLNEFHKDTCPGKKANTSISTLASQLELGTPIPNELENAAREVIKFKLLSSKDKTIEFKSGGPRVSD